MNSIPILQNQESQLLKLAAQRQFYATAKRILAFQLLLSGPVATFAAILSITHAVARPYLAVLGVLFTLLDVLWLSEWQKRKREQGAKAQEAFDCDVIELPWNSLKAGSKLDPELIKEQADSYRSWELKMPTLKDWYPPELGRLPLHIARIACQRANCWWDGKQRRSYGLAVLASMLFALVCIFMFAFVSSVRFSDVMLAVVLPVAPMIVAAVRQYREHTQAADRCDKLKEHANALWDDAMNGVSASSLKRSSRSLQDEIYDGRKRNPPSFDWLFRRLRSSYESQMTFGAAELIAEATRRLKLP